MRRAARPECSRFSTTLRITFVHARPARHGKHTTRVEAICSTVVLSGMSWTKWGLRAVLDKQNNPRSSEIVTEESLARTPCSLRSIFVCLSNRLPRVGLYFLSFLHFWPSSSANSRCAMSFLALRGGSTRVSSILSCKNCQFVTMSRVPPSAPPPSPTKKGDVFVFN